MIKYLFTNNDLLGSKLISRSTKREYQKIQGVPSHFAILLNDRWVLHSNFANGVNIQPYYHFKKKNNIIEAVRKQGCDEHLTVDCVLFFDTLIKKSYAAKYDFMAITYFGWRIAINYLFNIPIPDENKWEVSDKWFCNELFELILEQDLSMKTPNDLMFMMLEHPEFISCETFS